jgi:uncharacterized protein YoxC
VSSIALLTITQVDPALADAIQRISTMQMISAIAGIIIVIAIVAVAVLGLQSLLAFQRTLRILEKTVTRLAPRAEPVIDGARRIVDDTSQVTSALRDRAKETVNSLNYLNRVLQAATREAELRVRELAAVLRVVQEETQEMLLDTAATARGIRTVAAAFHAPSLPREHAADAGELEPVEQVAGGTEEPRRKLHGEG